MTATIPERVAAPSPRQPAYDAVYAVIRDLGDTLPADRVRRNATIWRAVEKVLDAMQPEFTDADLHRQEAGHLAYDPLKPGATVLTDHDQAWNPIRHRIHRTYEGRLAWICGHCLRVSLDPADGSEWTCCGEQDGTAVVSDPIVCAEGAGECLLAGTDDCICPDQEEKTR